MVSKRWRTPNAKPGEMKVAYGKEPHDEPDLMFCYGGGGVSKRDTNMLMYFFHQARMLDNGRCLIDELKA